MVKVDLRLHSAFFDRLVELIPAKHYLAHDEERTDLRFLKKKDREAAKAQFKQKFKESKREKLNPDTAKGTLELQKLKVTAAAAAKKDDALQTQPQPSDREILKEKLQKRLEELRKQRKADEQGQKVEKAKEWRDKALEQGRQAATKKRKQEALATPHKQQYSSGKLSSHASPGSFFDASASKKQHASGRNDGDDAGLAFGKIDFGATEDDRLLSKKNKKKRKSKEELLAEAETNKASLEADTTGQKAEKVAWSAALARAQGEKVFDDPRLLRKSIKKDQKIKKKKAQAWTERLEKQKEVQTARSNKRKENIRAKIDAKKETKKVRREKKLLRAGFEGRKQGFIATPSPHVK